MGSRVLFYFFSHSHGNHYVQLSLVPDILAYMIMKLLLTFNMKLHLNTIRIEFMCHA